MPPEHELTSISKLSNLHQRALQILHSHAFKHSDRYNVLPGFTFNRAGRQASSMAQTHKGDPP